jgi:hypothetical protein
MAACRDQTISGFNEYVQDIRKTADHAGLDALLTLTVFNGEVRMLLKSFMPKSRIPRSKAWSSQRGRIHKWLPTECL